MNQHIEDFLADVKASKARQTYLIQKSDLKRFESWLNERDTNIEDVNSKDVHRFLREEGEKYAEATVKSRYNSINQLYNFLSGVWEIVEQSPVEDLKRGDYATTNGPKKQQNADLVYATPNEVDQLTEHVPGPTLRNELLIRLMFQTGVRRSEVVEIELENVDREKREIDVWAPKTQEWRTVYYQPSLDLLLNQWIDGGYRNSSVYADESPHLILTNQSAKMEPNRVNEIVKDAAENAKIQDKTYTDAGGRSHYRITSHALRHGHAVYALKSGIDIRTVQKHLGHSNIETTMQYLQLIDDDVKEAYQRFGVIENQGSQD